MTSRNGKRVQVLLAAWFWTVIAAGILGLVVIPGSDATDRFGHVLLIWGGLGVLAALVGMGALFGVAIRDARAQRRARR